MEYKHESILQNSHVIGFKTIIPRTCFFQFIRFFHCVCHWFLLTLLLSMVFICILSTDTKPFSNCSYFQTVDCGNNLILSLRKWWLCRALNRRTACVRANLLYCTSNIKVLCSQNVWIETKYLKNNNNKWACNQTN